MSDLAREAAIIPPAKGTLAIERLAERSGRKSGARLVCVCVCVCVCCLSAKLISWANMHHTMVAPTILVS